MVQTRVLHDFKMKEKLKIKFLEISNYYIIFFVLKLKVNFLIKKNYYKNFLFYHNAQSTEFLR